MPNTLAHLGIGGFFTRTFIKKADLKWVYIGAVIPDFPWILQRIVSAFAPSINVYNLRLYCIALASLFISLTLSAAIANLTRNTKRVFLILATGAVIHLLLDSIEIKWANGVHLFAPFNWHLFNAGLFWPEDIPIYLLTLFGIFYVTFNTKKLLQTSFQYRINSKKKIIAAFILLILYFSLPFSVMEDIEANNNHFVKTLRDIEHRPGSYFEIDRGYYIDSNDGDKFRTPFKEELIVANLNLTTSESMSIRAKFISQDEIYIIEYHTHHNRDLYSYVGLVVILILFIALLVRNSKNKFQLNNF